MADILLGNVKGPQGNTGATGSQGPQGEAATITVGTVSTTAYGNTASVTNSGTEQDAVLDFVIPQGKPGEQTTRMGALTLDTITAQSADFPIPAVGETGSTVFGKIIKFFNSTISALNSKLNISDVVNNLTSTSTTQPLSAAQGKTLNDAYTTLNNTVYNHTEHPISVNSNFENFSWEALVYYKIGKIVFVHGAGTWKGSANPVNVVFATGLPKPRQNTSIPCALNASSNSVNVVVSLNGELRLYAASMATNTSFYVCLSYVEG